jgi:hypothetical protein
VVTAAWSKSGDLVTPVVLWVVGEPGVGKTTMVRALLPRPWDVIDLPGWPRWTLCGPDKQVVAAGTYTGHPFDGADRVGYNKVRQMIEWWHENLFSRQLTVLDGDRMSYAKAVEAWAGVDRACVLLEGAKLAEQRREGRGSRQDAAWVRGRRTKSERFAASFPGRTARILADQPPEMLAGQVLDFLGVRFGP